MNRRLLSIGRAMLVLLLLLLGIGLSYSVYRRMRTRVLLGPSAFQVEGIILEKLTEQQAERFLPFDITAYIIWYAYPNPEGKMRIGQQDVTRRLYSQLGAQGSSLRITYDRANPSLSAVDARLIFPGIAGWRAGLASACFLSALVFSVIRLPGSG